LTLRQEITAVALLSAGFGLVGVDRFIILPLFPAMRNDLGLTYQDLGLIASVFSIAWGIAAIAAGRLADRIGRRRTAVPAVLLFSLLAGTSGLTGGLASLILVRVLMGFSEGAYTPVAIAATLEASHPARRGFNLGLQQDLYAILGLGAAPILATQLLTVLPSWRGVFLIVSLPGFVLAWAMHRWLRADHTEHAHAARQHADWRGLWRYRNVPLNMLGMCCMLTALLVTTTMAPNYLVDVLHLPQTRMGEVLSGMGWGGFIGQLLLPGLSDRIGRKPVVLLCYAGSAAGLAVFLALGAHPLSLFAALFAVSFFVNSMICLNVGPLTVEAVPATLAATAAGAVVGCGEALGGGLTPGLAGAIAQHAGLHAAFMLAFAGLGVGIIGALALHETAPRIVARRAAIAA
jgi:MFS family permease